MNFWGILRAQNDCLVIGYLMGAEIFEFKQTIITWAWSGLFGHFLCSKWFSCHWLSDGHINILMLALFKSVAKVFWPISPHHFSNPHNFGLEWTFWLFSVLKMIVLSLAIWWAHKYFSFGLICACGGCSNRVPIKADFATFKGGILFVDFTLVCCQPNGVINRKNTH